MRPNLANNGQIPATPPFASRPDILLSGDLPVLDHQEILVVSKNNFIYVIGKFG